MTLDALPLQANRTWNQGGDSVVVKGDNLDYIRTLPSGSFRLIYIDPPFNTGKVQTRQTMKTVRSATGTRVGFKGQTYDTIKGVAFGYNDLFADYWEFLELRLEEAWELLSEDGTLRQVIFGLAQRHNGHGRILNHKYGQDLTPMGNRRCPGRVERSVLWLARSDGAECMVRTAVF